MPTPWDIYSFSLNQNCLVKKHPKTLINPINTSGSEILPPRNKI